MSQKECKRIKSPNWNEEENNWIWLSYDVKNYVYVDFRGCYLPWLSALVDTCSILLSCSAYM